jgi:CRP-like cAMP-binding protein
MASRTGSSHTCWLETPASRLTWSINYSTPARKRLARTLLLLARYGKKDKPWWVLPRISQEALAEMVGTTRSRVNFFMNKFKKLGFVEYKGGLKINPSLVTVVVHQ